MKKQVIIKPFFIILFISFVAIFAPNGYAVDAPKAGMQKAPSGLHAKRISESCIKVSWKKDKTAMRYIVYRYSHTKKKAVKIATTKKNYYLDKKLKKHKVHHYVVRSEGKYGRSELSYSVCCINWKNNNRKITNPKRVYVDQDEVQVDLFCNPKYRPSSFRVEADNQIYAKVYPEKKGKRPFNKKVRWFTTNKKIAVVKKDGTVIPIDSGKCYVYAKAQNGVNSKKIEVQVDDYALVDEFARPPEKELQNPTIETMAVILMEQNREHLCKVVSFIAKQQEYYSISMDYDGNYKMFVERYIPEDVKKSIEALAKMPYELIISGERGNVHITYGIIREDYGTEKINRRIAYDTYVEVEVQIIKNEYIELTYGGGMGMDSTIAPLWGFRSEVYTGPIEGRYVSY